MLAAMHANVLHLQLQAAGMAVPWASFAVNNAANAHGNGAGAAVAAVVNFTSLCIGLLAPCLAWQDSVKTPNCRLAAGCSRYVCSAVWQCVL